MRYRISGMWLVVALVLVLLGGVSLTTLSGCATFGPLEGQAAVERHQLLFKAAAQYGTLKIIEKNPNMAEPVARIAGDTADALEDTLEAGRLVALPALEEMVRAEINWDKLTPEEFLLIDTLITSVRLELARAEAEVVLPADDPTTSGVEGEATRQALYYAAAVLRWIEEAARLRIPA